ncbi:tetratricopeptide repeat protein [Maribacter hydrothermalis]|uniref:Uncharacterized protein n=1 Tax=Maribacter hydrothermalis TaxID=1836467 RepID=A0A1B7ZBU0_9FLAO|nr:hypothetical protein [Maribacter hydrothermalis]APQ15970.1 hypothetical protein BTR34_00825 [Maribacter hydrothermalis]OBR40387.1 hypothetical protein A9200_16030 [Maribacter hydrothermalis]
MSLKYTIYLLVFVMITSCQQKQSKTSKKQVAYTYGTENDSAIFYFNKGWEYILDYGQWTLSDLAFRKAVSFDSTFVIGKALVGKSTTDLTERIKILIDINNNENEIHEDDQLILEVTRITIELFNARDQKLQLSDNFIPNFMSTAEKNYREFIHKYPNESYIKAEYIEVLNAIYGPKLALDSLHSLTTPNQKKIPFFISYAATLESDLENFDNALSIANDFNKQINNPKIPQPYVLYGSIYLKMDSLSLATSNIDRALALDPNHIFAQRFKKQINDKLKIIDSND